MRAVYQRVSRARVTVGAREVAATGPGALILLGVGRDDTREDAEYMAEKVAGLRVFPDAEGKMNLSILDVGGEALVVSQFTLFGDVKKGKRPGFDMAMEPVKGRELYEAFVEELRRRGVPTKTGEFGAHMQVELVNDGPVTILISSKKEF
ncbi:MAG: D-tyrosyl-tRNA(Tyr) deacylase [Firmicutes bacterium]|nr:D-tyrosyl-tRNA(Tyr) deacylase [Candidatus Fermentithermobacillaceae bacterium]